MRPVLGKLFLFLALSPAVAASEVPRPQDIFGFRPGDDYKLADYSQMREFYRRLDIASDRIQVLDIGPTAEGRQMMLAIISSETNLASLEKYRHTAERLALAREDRETAARLVADGKAIVWIDGGLHASEVAHAQHSPELAYKVVTEETQEMQFIRDNVILLQVPVMNPDGLDIVVRWYKRNLGTEFETSSLPELYHKYVGHDNNRDWYMMTQPETRNVSRLLYRQWYPQIVYNHHQSAPFPARIFIPPFAPPLNPNIPPLVVRSVDLIGNAMSSRFEAEKKAGVISRISYDMWWNGGMRTVPYFHNMVGILTETALYKYATPHEYKKENFRKEFRNGTPTLTPSSDYPHPWLGGWWRLRDAVDYMLTASMAVLDVGARYRERWLENIYTMGVEAIERGRKGAPFAYLVPLEQHDFSAAIKMLETLRLGGVEIHQAKSPFKAGDKQYPAGTYIIYAAQAFRSYVLDLMEPQRYPDRRLHPGGPPIQPYDMTGWTLPMQMGVPTIRVNQTFEAYVNPLEEPRLPDSSDFAESDAYLIDRRWNLSYALVNELLARNVPVKISAAEVHDSEEVFPAGAFIVEDADFELLKKLSSEFRVPIRPLEGKILSELRALKQPRIGLYKSWVANMDEGWTRWLLEAYRFKFENIFDQDIRSGNLRGRFDVIVLPSQGATSIMRGHAPGSMPAEYVGGIGVEGFLELKQFVEQGGILVALDAATEVPLDSFNLPVKDLLKNVSSTSFYCPGSLLRLKVDSSDPLAYGMQQETAAFFVKSRAFRLEYDGTDEGEGGDDADTDSRKVKDVKSVAEYGDHDVLMSGWILGEERIKGKPAVVRARIANGEVVLIGFRCQFRGQPHGTFKLLFNSVYLAGMR